MRKFPTPVFCLALALSGILLVSCEAKNEAPAAPPSMTETAPAAVAERSETETMHAWMDEVYERKVAAWPQWETALGRKTDQQGEWNDHSDAYAEEQLELDRLALEYLRDNFDYEKLDANGRLSYELMVYNMEQALEDAAWWRHDYVVDQFRGQVADLFAFLQNEHAIDNEKDAEDYVSRIAGMGEVFAELARQLRDRSDFGVATPAFAYADMIADVGRMTSGSPLTDESRQNPLLANFRIELEALQLGQESSQQLENSATAALKGPFREGAELLMVELRHQQELMKESHGVWSLPDGDAYYRNRISHHTTLDLSPEQIHQAGLDDVARIHEEMRTIMAEARQQVAEIEAIADQYFNILPKAKMEVRRVERWRENSTSIAFYNLPSEDGSRPGIYYANMKDMANFQKYVFTAITYHESVPGHHFQIANAMELQGIPEFRKNSMYGAYTEGWALYAEQLAKDMGFYQDPMRDFGRLQDEIWRSVRLVTDTGIHAMRWTREQAIDYFQQNTPLSRGDIVTEVERFFVNPGQALGYKLGMMKILELRERARAELGDGFDIRAFHDVVIGRGAMPLPVLEQQIGGWIEGEAQNLDSGT